MEKKKNIRHVNSIALFGNPVKHSLSPLIHKNFSKEINIKYNYNTVLCTKSNFFSKLKKFFKNNGFGCNVTVPFKRQSFNFPNQYTDRAKISGSINTLKKNSEHNISGDNTDGIGLIYDLKRLQYIKKYTTVLLLGSGGVVYSVIYHLLKENCSVFILNRTISHSVNLIKQFQCFGKIFLFSDYSYKFDFDIIINATSCGLYNIYPVFPKNLVFSYTKCYDISYEKKNSLTPFLLLCKQLGSKNISDGLGMLVAQAAYSCYYWFGKLPNIKKNIDKIKLIQ